MIVATIIVETIVVETNIVPTRKTRSEEKVPIDNRPRPETPRVRAVTVGRGEVALPPVVEPLSYRILQNWQAKRGPPKK